MDKGRFSLLLLDPGEIYFEDFSTVMITPDTTIKTYDLQKQDGRLKLCSKSLVFDPKDIAKPLIKISLRDCTIIEEWKGSMKFINGENVFRVECKQYTKMLERNTIAPYTFCENGKFLFSLNYASVIHSLPQICQLKRATTLAAIEQDDMIATIVHSRHARVKFDPLWLDLYETMMLEMQADKITPLVVNPGRVVLSTSRLYFQPYNNIEMYPVIKLEIKNIKRIIKRRFLLRHIGIEIYYHTNDTNKELHIYLSLSNQNARDLLHSKLIQHPKLCLCHKEQDVMTLQWQNGIISNYEYISYINSLGDRTINDLTQYPVFPWIISDYTSKILDLTDKEIYRDLSKPVGALNESRLEKLMDRYHEMPDPKFIFGSHYSTPGFVLFYLVRLYPDYMLCLQNGRFDHPDRMFNSCADVYKNALHNMSDFKELIPEFYDTEQAGLFLVNDLGIHFGYRHNGAEVCDVELPPWADNPQHFVNTLRDALESDYVSQHLHSWIDLIFGYKQRGDEAINANNLYYYLCYEGNVDLESITDLNQRHTLEVQIMEFGQIPKQVFNLPHPKRRIGPTLLIEPSQIIPKQRKDENDLNWKKITSLNLSTTFTQHKDKVGCVFITEESDRIISVGHDSKMKVFCLDQLRQIRSANIGYMPLSSCLKIPHFNILIIGSFDNEIILYDMDFGRVIQTLTAHEDAIKCIAWDNQSNLLCSGSGDSTVRIWKGFNEDGIIKPIQCLICQLDHNSPVTSLGFDPSKKYLAVGTEDGEIYIWTMVDNTLFKKYHAHKSAITAITYSLDGLKLISCSTDCTFQVLDINTGMSLYQKTLKSPLMCLKLDAFILLIGSEDGILYVWDIVEVKLLFEVHVHNGPILSLDMSRDRKFIVTGGEDHTIKVWNPT